MIQIKNAKELDGMRRANALSAAALKYGGEHIEAGMTTWELDKLIYDFIVKHGGIPNFKGLYGFPGTACISLNDTVIHGIPSHDIVIRPGDIVSIDTGAKVDGFNGDNACTYAVGKVDLEAQRLLEVTKASLYKGIEQAVAGNRIGDIGYAVQSYCEDAGFSVVRDFVGHGTGKELHEDPEVPNYGHQGRGPRLVPGMTIAIEPMICQGDYKIKQLSDGWTVKTKDGGLAAHFEHSIAILKDRTEIMTRSWDDPDFAPATFSLKKATFKRSRCTDDVQRLLSLFTPAICAIVTSFREKVSPSRWRNAKGGRDGKELLYRIIFYRKYGKNLLQIDNKRCIIYKWLWKPDTSSTDRLSLPVLRILCRRR